MAKLTWTKLLSETRLPPPEKAREKATGSPAEGERVADVVPVAQHRTAAERDHDRILFATPTRRLGDKTQVFPLERNESVRTRLTHSHEVSNLARSCGTSLVYGPLWKRIAEDLPKTEEAHDNARRSIPAMLAAVGLAHDIGNPPFGHQGENAIRQWIKDNEYRIFSVDPVERKRLGDERARAIEVDLHKLSDRHQKDFHQFEGNAQTLRTLSRLQVVKDGRGLNLSFGTLAALLKYTVGSTDALKKHDNASRRKVGIYASEDALVAEVWKETGLRTGVRHPLTFLMEACDDIAYSIIDAEDAIKKGIVSFADLVAFIRAHRFAEDPLVAKLVAAVELACVLPDGVKLPPSELDDVSMQLFRTHAIGVMVSAVLRRFETGYDEIMEGKFEAPLVDTSEAFKLCEMLKEFDRLYAYRNRQVLEIELRGFNTLQGLMTFLWRGITEREDFSKPASDRISPFSRYAYGRISENYKRVFEGRTGDGKCDETLPMRYRELQLLTDMVAGMTDQYAMDLYKELSEFHVGASAL
ncbi:dGTP triphosphohydrolase [Fulvimarina sp. MAC8]|uniref:dGTP triphosphohydrolase n=1 Tax=Fulvimarina sp. MAC8 TaxID=3162874 RepID=UPI0032F091DF